ncbi:MAG TPA: type II toxin-antitoxin system prevent-host-death family antitoxin [Capillimicrobium sp.]|nr:type II toxin-antitoxin system prevent-host-death family antitoxin [Capillimicrobium sp.]
MSSRMSATHLARHLSEVLDAVEHHGQSFTIERHGKPIARIEAARTSSLRDWTEHLRRRPPVDEEFEHRVLEARASMSPELGGP